MPVIRNEQMEAFQRAARKDFEQRLLRHLPNVVPGLPDNVSGRIGPLVTEAFGLGIKSERDVARFCELMFRYASGKPFSSLPLDAQNVGLAYGVSASDKLSSLEQWFASREKAGA